MFILAELEIKQLDDRLIKILAYQRLQQLLGNYLNHTHNNHSNNHPQGNNGSNVKMPLPSELLTPADIDRISR